MPTTYTHTFFEKKTVRKISKGSWVLTPKEQKFFLEIAKKRKLEKRPQVLWGWKRDRVFEKVRYPESRTVYFSADFGLENNSLFIKRAYFFLDTRAKKKEIAVLKKSVGKRKEIGGYEISLSSWEEKKCPGYWRFRIEIGLQTDYDKATVARRLKGKPRMSIDLPKLVPECKGYDISKFAPFVVNVGSGLSSESGLPLLGEIHNLFEVDDRESGMLTFGADDSLPKRITTNPAAEFNNFCQFSVDAIKAKPSASHFLIKDLFDKGLIKQIFTDNMDDLLEKTGLPYTESRLSIFPDRYPAKFDKRTKSLLVIGVAVDRRDIIKQARKAGLKIIAINPVFGVAPHSRNMDYFRRGDIFFREKAKEVLPKIISASGF